MLERNANVGLFCADAILLDAETHKFYGYRPIVRPLHRAGTATPAQALRLLRTADNWIHTGSSVFLRAAVLAGGAFDADLGTFADGFMARKIVLKSGFCYAPVVVAAWCVSRDSASRKTAVDIEKARSILETIPKRIAADPDFPAWYADAFERRWRFATLRLALEDGLPDPSFMELMAVRSAADRRALNFISRLPGHRLRRLIALAWFWHRCRPYRLRDLFSTALSRMLEHRTNVAAR